MSDPDIKLKICPVCGKTFECSNTNVCWCTSFEISLENLEKLRKSFDDCLCPACLSGYSTKTENLSY